MTVEAAITVQPQNQMEDDFLIIAHKEDGVMHDRRTPRSKIRGDMSELAEQLLEKEIRSLYIRRY